MRYQVIKPFRVKTPKTVMTLQEGQIIALPVDKAQSLISEGWISPVNRVAYRLYSKVLQAYLWVVPDSSAAERLMDSYDVTEPIYTAEEVHRLNGMDAKGLKAINETKTIFLESTVKEVQKRRGGSK